MDLGVILVPSPFRMIPSVSPELKPKERNVRVKQAKASSTQCDLF
jgi:hypothetical protein